MTRPIRLRAFLAGLLAVFAVASGGTLLLPHDPYMRYQSFEGTIFSRLTWVYDRLAHDPAPVNVLFVGSSRTARGANVELIEAELGARGLGEVRVANVSEPAAGLDIRLTKISEAFAERPGQIRLVVLAVTEALPRDGHQAFGDLATVRELLTAPWIVNRLLPIHLAGLPHRQIELAAATFAPEAYGRRAAFDPSAYAGTTPDHRDFNDSTWREAEAAQRAAPEAHAEAMAKESAMRKRGITRPILPAALGDVEFGVSRGYIRRIRALAEAQGAEVVFLFLPFHQGFAAPVDIDWLESVAPVWSATWMMEDPMNYTDAAHASQQGVELLAPWLADRIASALEQGR